MVDEGDAKADKRMHLTGKEVYIFRLTGFILHQSHPKVRRNPQRQRR
jgi:hypothetical protein